MDLTQNDLGERYIDNATWTLLPGMASLWIPAPTVTGACDVPVFYSFSPPSCVKSIDIQMSVEAGVTDYVFGVQDTDEFLCKLAYIHLSIFARYKIQINLLAIMWKVGLRNTEYNTHIILVYFS